MRPTYLCPVFLFALFALSIGKPAGDVAPADTRAMRDSFANVIINPSCCSDILSTSEAGCNCSTVQEVVSTEIAMLVEIDRKHHEYTQRRLEQVEAAVEKLTGAIDKITGIAELGII